MLRPTGLIIAFATVLLQLAVYIQPILPEKFHIAPVCMSIMHNLMQPQQHQQIHEHYHELVGKISESGQHDHHQLNHQCQYCTVYSDLVLPFSFDLNEVFERIQIKLGFYINTFKHVYFSLQRLYLLPQGRAPPISL